MFAHVDPTIAIESLIESHCARLAVCRPNEVIYEAHHQGAAFAAVSVLKDNGYCATSIKDVTNRWYISTAL